MDKMPDHITLDWLEDAGYGIYERHDGFGRVFYSCVKGISGGKLYLKVSPKTQRISDAMYVKEGFIFDLVPPRDVIELQAIEGKLARMRLVDGNLEG